MSGLTYQTTMAVLWGLGFVGLGALVYDLLWGPDKRTLRSREYCYRNSDISRVTDHDFYEMGKFAQRGVPREYALAKRMEIADGILDYPPDRLCPDMLWEQIPLERCGWFKESFVDEFNEYLVILGQEPESFLHGKTIAQIIEALFASERAIEWHRVKEYEHPFGWETEISLLKKQIKRGAMPSDIMEGQSIADVTMELYKIRRSGMRSKRDLGTGPQVG